MEVPQPAKTALVEEGELMLEVTGTDVDARHAMKTVDEPHSAGPQPAVSHSPQQRRRRTALFATAACLIALLVAGGVAIALVAAGVLNLSSNGGGDGLSDNGEPWVYGKSKYGGANFSSEVTFPDDPWAEWRSARGNISQSQIDDLLAGEVGQDSWFAAPLGEEDSATASTIVVREQHTTLVHFASVKNVSALLDEEAAREPGVVTVNADYSDYIIFQELSCRGGDLDKTGADDPSACAQWCVSRSNCHAWTYSRDRDMCYFKSSCPELTSDDKDVTGIKRDSNGVVTVRIDGGSKKKVDNHYLSSRPQSDDDNSNSVHADDSEDDKSDNSVEDSQASDTSGRDDGSHNYKYWIIFRNMGCHGGTYHKFDANNPTQCSNWCAPRRDCHAFTFAKSSGVCYFKRRCAELTSEDQDVSGIKRDGDGQVTVRIDGGSKETYSSEDYVVTADDDSHDDSNADDGDPSDNSPPSSERHSSEGDSSEHSDDSDDAPPSSEYQSSEGDSSDAHSSNPPSPSDDDGSADHHVDYKMYIDKVCTTIAGSPYSDDDPSILGRHNGWSKYECEQRCMATSRCVAYEYFQVRKGRCHLRTACPFLIPVQQVSVETGVRVDADQPVTIPPDSGFYLYINGQGCKDPTAQTIRGITVERCQALCTEDDFCRAYTYNRNTNTCYTKEACDNLQSSAPDFSAIKTDFPTNPGGGGSGGGGILRPPSGGSSGLISCNNAGCLDTQGWLDAHNARREFYHTEAGLPFVPLQWSPGLALMAQEYAVELVEANDCRLDHCVDRYGGFERCQFGENLAWQSAGVWNGDSVLQRWTEEELEFLGVSFRGGHASQVLWRSTRYVGCGQAEGACGKVQVCRYIKPGNCDSYAFWLSDFSACGPECPPEGCF